MRRRSFIATIPAAAAATASFAGDALAKQQTAAANAAAQTQPPAKFQPAGEDKFVRPDVRAGDRPAGPSFASRSAAMGCNGAAGTAHPLASLSAIDTLKRGGSAVDAAIAANACLGFLEPTSSGLGGDCFAFIWDPKVGKLASMAASGRSPKSLSLEMARSRAKNGALPPLGAISVSTPGALDGWWSMHQRYGKLKWAELFEPAIHLCESGVPVPQIIGYYIGRNMAIFNRPNMGIEEKDNANHVWMPGGHA